MQTKPLVVDRLTRKGTGDKYFWIIQDGEGEGANEILRIPSTYTGEGIDPQEEKAVQFLVCAHNAFLRMLEISGSTNGASGVVAEFKHMATKVLGILS